MFEPLVEIARWIASVIPRDLRIKKFRLNYLMVHYIYLTSWSIIGSIILFGNHYMSYTNALFFAVGSATQSGLNPINVNDLYLYQQVTIMLIACVTNPIFINTGVVFVRLYWFEKRFTHIVEELREQRRNRAPTISRTKSEMKADRDLEASRNPNGVGGRQIRVLHETTQPNGLSGSTGHDAAIGEFKEKMGLDVQKVSEASSAGGSNQSSEDGVQDDAIRQQIQRMTSGESGLYADESPRASRQQERDATQPSPTLHHRDVRFADEIQPAKEEPTAESDKPAEHAEHADDLTKHIEFFERQQRNAKEGTTLRIPGPRAFERGEKPEELSDSDDDIRPMQTQDPPEQPQMEGDREGANTEGDTQLNADDHTQRTNIKFEAQDHPAHRQHTDSRSFDESRTEPPKSGLSRAWTSLRRPRSNLRLPNPSEARGTIGHTFSTLSTVLSGDRDMNNDPMPYLSWQATTGRNSAFLGLTEEQREELGGIEYRSLKTLAKILMFYFVGFHLSGLVVNLPYILIKKHYKNIVESDGQNATWWAIFTAASEFNDLGMTLTPDSMNSFNTATGILLYGSILIIIGNTGFPIMLRFVIWCVTKFTPYGSRLWEELRFLLDHPRRCFTLLFPSKANWWLFWILVLLNGTDLVFYIILDLHDPTVTDVAPRYRVLDGWYQAVSTRTAGFSVVNLYYLHPAIQVSYLIMMYISVFPIAISVRRTNVYEEKSLGIFGGEEEGGDDAEQSYVGQHLRRQLSFDLWFIFLGLFIIAIVEGDRLQNTNDYAFTMFSVLFEIVSAYGTVGLSLGYPGTDTSFSAQFKVLSKLIIMAMMLRGRHRGLPYALDRAILLPSDHLQKKEAEDADRQLHRRGSIFAEANEVERRKSHPGGNWSQFELDENGLPKQHLDGTATIGPMTTGRDSVGGGGGGDSVLGPRASLATVDADEAASHLQAPQRAVRRRGSAVSVASASNRRRRSRSLSRVLAGGLSAGPTFSKYD